MIEQVLSFGPKFFPLRGAARSGSSGKKRAVDIWVTGEVVQIANGTTDKESPRCKNLLEAGAVRIKWPEDTDFEEKEQYTEGHPR